MTKLLSRNFISLIPIGIAIWVAGILPARADSVSKQSQQPTAENKNQVVNTVTSEPTPEQLEQAKEASEIKPGDWAYQTLQALSSKYSYANTPSGKILSREEFATSLNGCVQSMEELIARRKPRRQIRRRRSVAPAVVTPPPVPEVAPQPETPPPVVAPPEPQVAPEEPVSQQDLDRLTALVYSFSAELQAVDSRVTILDDKVAKLEKQAFSTTTKLTGEAIFAVSGFNTGRGAGIGTNGTTGNILSDRVRLNFDTSFTGKDRLRTRLESRNTTSFNTGVTGTNMTRLGFDGDSANNTSVALLNYGFPISPETRITVDVVGARFNDHLYTHNPILTSSGSGAISRFGRFNPVYRLSSEGAALTVNHQFSKELDLSVGYAVPNINAAASTAQGSGLFNGSNAIISQLNIRPVKDLSLGLIYGRAYTTNGANINGSTGSVAANSPFGAVPTTTNYYSFATSYKISPNFVLSGWAGFTEANRQTAAGGSASTSNYAISLAFPDLGQKGNNLAFIFGIPPRLNSRSGTGLAASPDSSTSYHLEALYKVKLSDNLDLTPGILLITNPEHNSANPTEYVGTIRTTFKF
jgi:hypothetical protein